MPEFRAEISSGMPIITDGGIETRIMFETDLAMDPHLQVAAMVSDSAGRAALRSIYESYVHAVRGFPLPLIIGSPTFRASVNFVRAAGRGEGGVRELNADAVRLMREVRDGVGHRPVFIAGVLGPSGDAYTPGEALASDAAAAYHRVQSQALAEAGVDFLFAPHLSDGR